MVISTAWCITAQAQNDTLAESPSDKRCASMYTTEQMKKLSRASLAAEYKRLRSTGCMDKTWGSDYHHIMEHLAKRLVGTRRGKIRKIMGRPDEVEKRKVIYYWRGRAGYVYFEFLFGIAVKSDWYHIYE